MEAKHDVEEDNDTEAVFLIVRAEADHAELHSGSGSGVVVVVVEVERHGVGRAPTHQPRRARVPVRVSVAERWVTARSKVALVELPRG